MHSFQHRVVFTVHTNRLTFWNVIWKPLRPQRLRVESDPAYETISEAEQEAWSVTQCTFCHSLVLDPPEPKSLRSLKVGRRLKLTKLIPCQSWIKHYLSSLSWPCIGVWGCNLIICHFPIDIDSEYSDAKTFFKKRNYSCLFSLELLWFLHLCFSNSRNSPLNSG